MIEAVVAQGLSKNYGELAAVRAIDFNVAAGEAFGLLGPNGAGKSTTMRMIACRSPLTAGHLEVCGLNVLTHARHVRRLIGVVPQENNLDPDITVRDNLRVYARYFQLDEAHAKRRIDDLLDFIGLTEKSGQRIDALSGGMKRRLMIARALLHEPRVLILDEPTTGLDPHVRQDIWTQLEVLRRERHITILLSTHYMDEAEKLCDRLVFIERGAIRAAGTPRQLVQDSLPKFVLEVRETVGGAPLAVPHVRAVERGGAQLYFADEIETLTHLLSHFAAHRTLLRPTNLEDVFLEFVELDGE